MQPDAWTQRGSEHTEAGLPLEEARRRILAELAPVSGSERVPLATSLGRVLAEDVHAAVSVPPHDNAAMDGYAVRSADLPAEGAAELHLAGRVLAGERREAELPPGGCLRIMTGAPLPPGADAVVVQERAEAVDAAHV
ncbi:MAG: molybdopterin molybdenumtransferase MoeA, partial [Halorhodospira sp.]